MTCTVHGSDHRWQPGPLVPATAHPVDPTKSTPATVVLVCACGTLWRKALPWFMGVGQPVPDEWLGVPGAMP